MEGAVTRDAPMLAQKKKLPIFANRNWPTTLAHRLREKHYFKSSKKKKLPTNFVGQPILLLAVNLNIFVRKHLVFRYFFWKRMISKKKKLPTFLLASHFFFLGPNAFFFKVTFQKKKLPTKPRRANIGSSLPVMRLKSGFPFRGCGNINRARKLCY